MSDRELLACIFGILAQYDDGKIPNLSYNFIMRKLAERLGLTALSLKADNDPI